MPSADVPPEGPGAVILRWPEDADLLAPLRAERRPRLLVLPVGATPPGAADELEDWLWLPADERDLYARLARLEARARPVTLDAVALVDDVLRTPQGDVALPPVEAALVGVLLAAPRGVRSRAALAEAAWGDPSRVGRSLDSRVLTLRRRLAPVGLAVAAVRGQGFVLVVSAPPDGEAW